MSHAGVLVGYARTSTTDQRAGLEAQLRDLKSAGCAKIQLHAIARYRPGRWAVEFIKAP
jgi:DNA invertase Pin-like site-specific DNA recombinase